MSFKKAFLVVIALHVVGYLGIAGLSKYKQAARQAAAADKQKWESRLQTNSNSYNDYPRANQRKVATPAPKKETKVVTQAPPPIKQEDHIANTEVSKPVEVQNPEKNVAQLKKAWMDTQTALVDKIKPIKVDEKKLKKTWSDSQIVVADCVRKAAPVQKNVEKAIENYRTTVKKSVTEAAEYVVEEIIDRRVISSRIVVQ